MWLEDLCGDLGVGYLSTPGTSGCCFTQNCFLWAPQVVLLFWIQKVCSSISCWNGCFTNKDNLSFDVYLLTWIPSVFCTVHIGLCNFYIFLPECTYSLAVFISVMVEMTFSVRNSNFLRLLILQNNYRSDWNSLGWFSSQRRGLGGGFKVCSTSWHPRHWDSCKCSLNKVAIT